VHDIKRDDRGWGLHNIFSQIENGQINISETYPNVIRAYHRHKYQTDYWRVLKGSIEVRLFYPVELMTDAMYHYIKTPHLKMVLGNLEQEIVIPAGVWHGFRVLGNESAVLLYYVTNKYNPNNPDEERMAWDTFGPWETEFK